MLCCHTVLGSLFFPLGKKIHRDLVLGAEENFFKCWVILILEKQQPLKHLSGSKFLSNGIS